LLGGAAGRRLIARPALPAESFSGNTPIATGRGAQVAHITLIVKKY
jgi:hypothetical protein